MARHPDIVKHLFSDDSASGPLRQAFSDLWKAAGEAKPRVAGAHARHAGVVRRECGQVDCQARNSATLDKVWRMFSDMGGTEKVHGEIFSSKRSSPVPEERQRSRRRHGRAVAGPSETSEISAREPGGDQRERGGAHKAAAAKELLVRARTLKSERVEIGDTDGLFPSGVSGRREAAARRTSKKAAEAAYRQWASMTSQAADDWYNAIVLKGDGVPEVPFTGMSRRHRREELRQTREIPADVARRASWISSLSRPVHAASSTSGARQSSGAFGQFGRVDDASSNAK